MGAVTITESKYLTDEEADHLIALCKQNKQDRDSILIRLLLYTGARGCEVLSLTAKDFSNQGTVTIRGAKGSNARTVPLTSDDYLFPTEIRAYITTYNIRPNQRLFPITTRRLRQIWDFWRPNKHKGSHSIRHTTGIKFYLACEDIHKVKSLLGHRQINNTQVYLDFCHGTRTLGKAMKGMWKKRISEEKE